MKDKINEDIIEIDGKEIVCIICERSFYDIDNFNKHPCRIASQKIAEDIFKEIEQLRDIAIIHKRKSSGLNREYFRGMCHILNQLEEILKKKYGVGK